MNTLLVTTFVERPHYWVYGTNRSTPILCAPPTPPPFVVAVIRDIVALHTAIQTFQS